MHNLNNQYEYMAPRIHSQEEPFYSLDYIEAIVDDLEASEEDPEDEPLWKRMQELRDIYELVEGVKVPEFTRLNVDFQDTGNMYEGAAPARWTDVNSRKHTDKDGEREDEALARRLQEEWAE